MRWREINFDGLVGPTHNYAGLSFGNVASIGHQGEQSNPKQAALQGLAKMRWLMDRGFLQGVLPPQVRPDINSLRRLGFRGTPEVVLANAWDQAPQILSLCSSASSMWLANAATVIPSRDNRSGRCIILPANLVSNVHRSIEVAGTVELLRYVFSNSDHFQVESPLPSVAAFADEGAANHMSFALQNKPAVHMFVYGRMVEGGEAPVRYPARQTREACSALIRFSGLDESRCMQVQQNPDAIDAGVFHNDVIAVSHDGLLLCHEKAFLNQPVVLEELRKKSEGSINIVEVSERDVPLEDAVNTYLFNSQILGDRNNPIMLLPIECSRNEKVRHYIETDLGPALNLQEIGYLDLQQSMANGGGPACLRLRISLNDAEVAALQGKVLLSDELHRRLVEFVEARYPDSLTLKQLADWEFTKGMINVVQDLYELLGLPTYLLDVAQQ